MHTPALSNCQKFHYCMCASNCAALHLVQRYDSQFAGFRMAGLQEKRVFIKFGVTLENLGRDTPNNAGVYGCECLNYTPC